MTCIALFTVLSNQGRYFEVSFRELVNISAVGKEKLFSLFKKLCNYYHHSQPRGKYSTPIITALLRNHSLTLWVKKKKSALIPHFLQMPSTPMVDNPCWVLFEGRLEKERVWCMERRGPEKAGTMGGKVGREAEVILGLLCTTWTGQNVPGWSSGQRPRLWSLLDAFLDPAQAKNVHSGCSICFPVINEVHEKYQKRSNSTNVIKMNMNNDPAKNECSNVLTVIKQVICLVFTYGW